MLRVLLQPVLLMKRLHQCLLLPLPYDVRAWLRLMQVLGDCVVQRVFALHAVHQFVVLLMILMCQKAHQVFVLGQMGRP